ncbi:MAG TPA: hypothetical protein VFU36_15800 [Jatrophihabitans sp.]|nr:hypothetical protein [Jatrophihabitans sp.]
MTSAVIVAPAADVHAQSVCAELRTLSVEPRILDVDEFTVSYDLNAAVGTGSAARLELQFRDSGARLVSEEISGLWWRRPAMPLDAFRTDRSHGVMNIARAERRSALLGALTGLIGNAFNDQGRSRQAALKPAQLVRATLLGLQVPQTLVSNDPAAVRAFHERTNGRTVYKMFNGSPFGLYGTRSLEPADLENLERLQAGPAIFQERVDGDFDVRATVVGDEVFAAKLAHDRDEEVVDTRFLPARITPHPLPAELARTLVRYVREAGLVYSAIDLRYSPDRGYVFFEANPEGQFLWIEQETGLPISRAIAGRLAAGPPTGQPAAGQPAAGPTGQPAAGSPSGQPSTQSPQ